ncbi:MAG: EAL domain-containing protein [Clostridia bacterium]|nr:EAL domain-containing protein [Clostridia bacterium]MDD4047238.1 EAL domain-containing protein [Clostridia bacterium]
MYLLRENRGKKNKKTLFNRIDLMFHSSEYKKILITALTLFCFIIIVYDSLFLKKHYIFKYSLYFPIALAGLWYGKKQGMGIALFLGGSMLISDISVNYIYINEDLFQLLMFILIGYVIGNLKERDRHSEKIIEHQVFHDMLTGLPNRMMFEGTLQNELEVAKINNKICAVIFIDLDGFKDINDILGHIAGDKILVEVGKRLKDVLYEARIIARSGGDEFLALISNLSNEEEISAIAVRLTNDFKKRFIIHEQEVYITLSIGISIFPNHGDDAESLISRADIAMYKSKDAGRNTFSFFTLGMKKDISEKLNIANYMRQLVEEKNFKSFIIHYQPLVEGESGEIVCVEALLRWNVPGQGLVYPVKFINIAEETGLIVPIGIWVLREACIQIKKWQDTCYPGLKLSVNISGKQLRYKNFVNDVKSVLKETGFKPQYLELEITESVAMNNSKRNIMILDELMSTGIRIALDDFGTGYSSLNYLGMLPINILKVDYGLVREIPLNKKHSAIATSIISLACSLEYDVVAEGVETKEQLMFFRQQKCKYIQGFLFSKALPVDELELLLNEKYGNAIKIN